VKAAIAGAAGLSVSCAAMMRDYDSRCRR
jgi:hypothetical protein